MTKKELIEKLANSVGVDKATSTVSLACTELRIGANWSQEDALVVLEKLAEDQGIIGTVARFAKVRVILAGAPPPGLGLALPTRKR